MATEAEPITLTFQLARRDLQIPPTATGRADLTRLQGVLGCGRIETQTQHTPRESSARSHGIVATLLALAARRSQAD